MRINHDTLQNHFPPNSPADRKPDIVATDKPMNPLYFGDNLFVLREHIASASVE